MAKTRRKRLKQFAILDASICFACSPESHDSTHSMTMRAVDRTMKPQEMPRNAEAGLFTM
ncbi:MAG: hypothetical protein C4548_15405 [Desulfobacteraceae bacterium]|nr:MAG: hypothetical protein C4548_15405 [Desulfobacteraceae bacterium]